MTRYLAARPTADTIPIHAVRRSQLKQFLDGQAKSTRAWAESTDYKARPGEVCLVPGRDGSLGRVLVGTSGKGCWDWAGLPLRLPKGRYRIDQELSPNAASDAALGWALGTYAFTRYRKPKKQPSTLVWPKGADRRTIEALVTGIFLGRDLINTPADDMGPAEIAAAAKDLATRNRAKCTVIEGDKLLEKGYPAIHTVGRGSERAPRLVDLRWGKTSDPKVTLVGKGVCFDSGGLNLKPTAAITLMKKDMGGAAIVLGLAESIMATKLPVRLRVLIPAVENSLSGNAYHPLDVIRTRKGITVEVGNTDAEGRLVLCDALADADAEHPDLLIDVSTLTGAARVALGTDLPALFSNNDTAADALLAAGKDVHEPLWRLPLHRPYRTQLDSRVADIGNVSNAPYGGAITAALFLAEFVGKSTPWIHIDTMAWNLENKPGRPAGGEAMSVRALYRMLCKRYLGDRA